MKLAGVLPILRPEDCPLRGILFKNESMQNSTHFYDIQNFFKNTTNNVSVFLKYITFKDLNNYFKTTFYMHYLVTYKKNSN